MGRISLEIPPPLVPIVAHVFYFVKVDFGELGIRCWELGIGLGDVCLCLMVYSAYVQEEGVQVEDFGRFTFALSAL
jgi:hypothetical protein